MDGGFPYQGRYPGVSPAWTWTGGTLPGVSPAWTWIGSTLGYPISWMGYPIQTWERGILGTPYLDLDGAYPRGPPSAGWGTPHQLDGYPPSRPGKGVPPVSWMGYTPIQTWKGGTPIHWMGSPSRSGNGVPPIRWMGYLPCVDWHTNWKYYLPYPSDVGGN